MYNYVQLHSLRDIYALMYFDEAAREVVYDDCANVTAGWNQTLDEFAQNFQFNFGILNNF